MDKAMDFSGGVTTWLELAALPATCRSRAAIRIHPVEAGRDGCFALSMDGRWLCMGDGRLTLFSDLESAEHFLEVLHVEEFVRGESIGDEATSDVPRYCLSLHRGKGLVGCAQKSCAVGSGSGHA